eukprot:TRINITY_DN45463_c0_g1_i1.p2 TRINITY_DN45463_c0_g1~~TRINITY_DN45463_c0_g1_i1.p2  ORF type:complete len:206 (-),score=33.30 TRINITY_DN45463_c0_g1_i1:560-1177(-)
MVQSKGQQQIFVFFFFLMIRRPPRSTQGVSSAASDVYKRQVHGTEALKNAGVVLRGDEKSQSIINDINEITEEEWDKEYLDYIIAVKIVKDVDEAIKHINRYGTGHSEAIVTESYKNSQRFLQRVDAAAVYVNASTRFTDGSEFGFGAEIGISTQKLHARGPMGLKELTTIKYIIYGNGQIRQLRNEDQLFQVNYIRKEGWLWIQ